MERRAIHEDPDGYYFRSPTGKLYGPLSRFQFESWSLRGAVGPGSASSLRASEGASNTSYRHAESRSHGAGASNGRSRAPGVRSWRRDETILHKGSF